MSREGITRVEAQGLTKMFGTTPALRGVSVALDPGSVTLLAGPNGAGKSTLLAILGTQLRPTRGQVVYRNGRGENLGRAAVRTHLGWVSHESHCYAQLSGRQNIELAAELRGLSPDRFDVVAERVGLGRFAERPVGTLSRGQTQRVALARALVGDPTLLLLDEPWTGLDARSSELLEDVVREETTRGTIVVVVSHAAGLAERLGARRIDLLRGRVASGEAP